LFFKGGQFGTGAKGLNSSLATEGRKKCLRIHEVETKYTNMSLAEVNRYLHNMVIDYSNVVTKPTNTCKRMKVYYKQIV
jgi:hypothetical protein